MEEVMNSYEGAVAFLTEGWKQLAKLSPKKREVSFELTHLQEIFFSLELLQSSGPKTVD